MAINLMYIKWESDVLWGTPDYADADSNVEHVFFKYNTLYFLCQQHLIIWFRMIGDSQTLEPA